MGPTGVPAGVTSRACRRHYQRTYLRSGSNRGQRLGVELDRLAARRPGHPGPGWARRTTVGGLHRFPALLHRSGWQWVADSQALAPDWLPTPMPGDPPTVAGLLMLALTDRLIGVDDPTDSSPDRRSLPACAAVADGTAAAEPPPEPRQDRLVRRVTCAPNAPGVRA